MPSQGPNDPVSIVNDLSNGGVSWNDTENASSSDDSYATCNVDAMGVGAESAYLKATDFGFSIPADSIITGIVVEIERSSQESATTDSELFLVKGGTISGDSLAEGSIDWPSDDEYKTYGDSNELWGLTFEPDDINAQDFGLAFSAKNFIFPDQLKVDHLRITVYYLPSGPINYNFSAESGSFSISGSEAELIVDSMLIAESGSFNIEGSASLIKSSSGIASCGKMSLGLGISF